MTNPTCPYCQHVLTAADVKAIAKPAERARMRRIGSAGGKVSGAKADISDRARNAVNARWKKHREARAKTKKETTK
jgi:hypothetical protein